MVARRIRLSNLKPSSTAYKWSADSTSALALRKNNHGTYNANRQHQRQLRQVWQRQQRILTINSSSNRIHLAKYLNKPTGPATELQVAQMKAFATQQKMAAAWLRANRPSEENGPKGTEAYQEAQALKKLAHLSNIRQIVLKYMDEEGNVTLPASGTTNGGYTPPTDSGSNPEGAGGGSGNDSGSGSTGTDTGSTDDSDSPFKP